MKFIEDIRKAEIERRSLSAHSKNIECKVKKVDTEIGVVFGFAIVSTINGADYYDTQGDNIPEGSMLKASVSYFSGDRIAKDMHQGGPVGQVVFGFPLTAEIAKSLEIETVMTGLIVGMKPESEELLQKYKTGEYQGFSIGGQRVRDTEQ